MRIDTPSGPLHIAEEPIGSPEFWGKMAVSAALVLLGGVFAGLTLGLMGLDELHLRVLAASSDDDKEKANATKVLKLLTKGRHWVLVVLLLGNVVVNESLPIFLDGAIGGGIAAVVISTVTIGMVIPQAVSVRYGLSIGAACAPFVQLLMYILAPIAWPTAKLLDKVLGVHSANTYKKAELKSFLSLHRNGEEPLRDDEINILSGVLDLGRKKAEGIMTPIKDVVTMSADTILDDKTMEFILSSGYSRIPIHEPGQPLAFRGLLLIKRLLTYDPAQMLPVSNVKLSILPEATPDISCFQALDYFQTGRAHLLLISQTPGVPDGGIGVVTLEDIIEEIISEEIVDETDRFEDNQSKRAARRITTSAVMKGIVERERIIRQNPTENGGERQPLLSGAATPSVRRPHRSKPECANGSEQGLRHEVTLNADSSDAHTSVRPAARYASFHLSPGANAIAVRAAEEEERERERAANGGVHGYGATMSASPSA
ncbi:DUF21-domain-containing protein [Coniophora puteana RWD-64-598 SS2]|uniref:DUF21-domain-containing protein n=1 Tax=Coniophora puteana (strain RWD-64-598) TaxID=741705 RepID=A0A5M3N3Z7_CONPW|nr:DUF21-domain-containing protein [Coniophora puteana RWD-64-598 SS2]EIW86152.1 DUF21-domain-containing protein [Coniophora puteana RWD-64-598 SS2]